GNVAGAAIGTLVAGPAGALVGAAAGPMITRTFSRICQELYDRNTGHRGRVRGGAAAATALALIAERLGKGEQIRSDDFFQAGPHRSSAEEVLEGVVIKSRDEHEEKKAPFYGYIFATAAFDDRFSAEALHRSLVLAQVLTYRQLCLLHLFSHPHPIPLRNADYRESGFDGLSWETVAVVEETFDLYRHSLIACRQQGSMIGTPLFGMGAVHPA